MLNAVQLLASCPFLTAGRLQSNSTKGRCLSGCSCACQRHHRVGHLAINSDGVDADLLRCAALQMSTRSFHDGSGAAMVPLMDMVSCDTSLSPSVYCISSTSATALPRSCSFTPDVPGIAS
jgi:hypothetical protein